MLKAKKSEDKGLNMGLTKNSFLVAANILSLGESHIDKSILNKFLAQSNKTGNLN
ncbi:hypothetical protein Pcaca02_42680 [Pectobacterium carotovorum subsp. carotovorum]|nr:hypothetical protein Pcaca02_42680 [Pectobacterium carotovorum subsp. carotovorum]